MEDSVIWMSLGVFFLIMIIFVVIYVVIRNNVYSKKDKIVRIGNDSDTDIDSDTKIDSDTLNNSASAVVLAADAPASTTVASTPDPCDKGYSYTTIVSDKKCADSISGVLLFDSNPLLCKNITSTLKVGDSVCLLKTKDTNLAYLSPRIINTRWDLTENYSNINTIKTKLIKTYSTDFKYSSEAEFLKDWRPLELQGGGFTESVRIKENVKVDKNNGLNLGVKVIKEGNINSDDLTKIKKNEEFKKFKYSTGGISSKGSFGYGYYEATYTYAQAKFIDNAFWLTNVYNSTWDGWEIDINEGFIGKESLDYKATILKWGNGYSGGVNATKSGNFSSDVAIRTKKSKESNRFGLLYTPNILVWYVNDKPFFKVTPTSDFTKKVNDKGEKIGFIQGNMSVKFTNGLMIGNTETEKNLVNSVMNVTDFTYYS